jgi:hypothetical protein
MRNKICANCKVLTNIFQPGNILAHKEKRSYNSAIPNHGNKEVIERGCRLQILNPKSEARNKSKIPILKCSKHNYLKGRVRYFGHLDFENWSLPFDFAQSGELVEPFRI